MWIPLWTIVDSASDMVRPVSSAAMDVPPLEAVVFDMDGTLIDSSRVVPAAFIATSEELGGPPLDRDEVIASYVPGPPATIMEHFLGRPVEPSEIDGYHARLRAEAERGGVQPYRGIPEALEALARFAALGVYTNADLGNVDVLLGAAGLRDRFAVVVGAVEVAPNFTPARDGRLLAGGRLRVPAARTSYVGDSPEDGETADHAGALAVAARWGHLMEDVGGFDVVADRPTDLPTVLRLT